MILDASAQPLLEQLHAANEAEGAATNQLLTYMKGGGKDNKILETLTNSMTNAHNKKMSIFSSLQEFRLDK